MRRDGYARAKFASIVAACLLATFAFAQSANATALTLGDSQELGFVNYGIPAGDEDRLHYINHLIAMSLGSADTALGQDFTRSNNDFGSLTDAQREGNVKGTSTSVDLGSGGTFDYLLAKYDGPNFGTEVWYVGNLSGIITIPAGAGGTSGSKYGLSGTMLFLPDPPASVPEPSSLALAAAGLLGLMWFGRRRGKIA